MQFKIKTYLNDGALVLKEILTWFAKIMAFYSHAALKLLFMWSSLLINMHMDN